MVNTTSSSVAFFSEIRRRREAQGLTLEDLAARSGLTPNYIGTIEGGKRDPSLSTLLALAKGLGVQLGELLGGTAGLGAAGIEAGRLYESIPGEAQPGVMALLRSLAKKKR